MNILKRFKFFLGIKATVGKSLSFRGQFISATEAKRKKNLLIPRDRLAI